MPNPINPYVAGNPVGDSPAFIGRADVLREVLRVLRRPQDNAIVLYGQRRIGKTSILQHLATQLPKEGPYHPVYFDLQDKAAWPLGRVLRDLARTIAHTLGQPDPDLGADPETAFRQMWLPAVLGHLPEDYSLVLLLDEFDVLADPKAEQAAAAFFPYLRELLASDPQRLNFVFVIGRNVNDLTNIALSLFKGILSLRVSLLDLPETIRLVLLSEENNTLRWPRDVVDQVRQLTHGHAFLTQQLCSHVWECMHEEELDEPPTVSLADVDAAIPDALEASRNTLEWLWDGLPPAERVVISALAEAGSGCISQEDLERILRESGVRVLIRELQNAPQLLQDWDLIEPANGGYCFRVELLRQWIVWHKPLRRVQEELDRVEPVAESLYQAAVGLYRSKQLDQAVPLLQQAVSLNPNHVGANLLLADILLAQSKVGESIVLLERLYQYLPAAARPRLVQTLLALAQTSANEDNQLALYDRVLELEPSQLEATSGRKCFWQQRGDHAFSEGDLDAALRAYKEADLSDKVSAVEQKIRRRQLTSGLEELGWLEQAKQYEVALDLVRKLAGEYPELRDWQADLERLDRKTHLTELYQRALGALQSGDKATAQSLLAQVVAVEPTYEEATRYLDLAVRGVDVVELQEKASNPHYPHILTGKPSPESEFAAIKQDRLSPWDPLDYLRLLWWVLITPRQLKIYREAFGEQDEQQVGNGLVSALLLLALLMPILALKLETLPRTSAALSPSVCLGICLLLLLAWAFTSMARTSIRYWVLAVGVTVGVAVGAAFGVAFGVAGGEGGGVTGIMALLVAGGVAGVAAGVMALLVAGGVAFGVAVGVAFGLAFGVAFGVAFSVAFVIAFVMALVMGESLKTDIASPWVRGEAAAMVLSYAFLVWFCFLGGWRVFAQ